ncbi:MAG: hypothetical protein ACI89F_000576 [Porticoccaceae bacterium]|jgi:hypothetical protein
MPLAALCSGGYPLCRLSCQGMRTWPITAAVLLLPTSSAYLIGARTAMVKRADANPASKYVAARVVVGGRRGYITPVTLQQHCF